METPVTGAFDPPIAIANRADRHGSEPRPDTAFMRRFSRMRCVLPAALDRFMEIAQEFFHSFALSRATRNGRDLGPESALLRIMHNDFDFHTSSPTDIRR
jgi:hypothetical protein